MARIPEKFKNNLGPTTLTSDTVNGALGEAYEFSTKARLIGSDIGIEISKNPANPAMAKRNPSRGQEK
jgi:hypothetical protein